MHSPLSWANKAARAGSPRGGDAGAGDSPSASNSPAHVRERLVLHVGLDGTEYDVCPELFRDRLGIAPDAPIIDRQSPRFRVRSLPHGTKIYRFMVATLNLIDLVAILPFYIEFVIPSSTGGSLAVFRVLRLARVFRIFKIGKYSASMQSFGRVMSKSLDALVLMIFFVVIGAVLFGSMMFFAEGGEFDETLGKYMRDDLTGSAREETPFVSIPASFWFILVTTTTVGYGDYVPTSSWGKLVAAITMHLGVLVLALPITIISANFAIEVEAEQRRKNRQKHQPSTSPDHVRGRRTVALIKRQLFGDHQNNVVEGPGGSHEAAPLTRSQSALSPNDEPYLRNLKQQRNHHHHHHNGEAKHTSDLSSIYEEGTTTTAVALANGSGRASLPQRSASSSAIEMFRFNKQHSTSA
jgi:voltage-gated potassium channel Kch